MKRIEEIISKLNKLAEEDMDMETLKYWISYYTRELRAEVENLKQKPKGKKQC